MRAEREEQADDETERADGTQLGRLEFMDCCIAIMSN
jgi:hypothetical protein